METIRFPHQISKYSLDNYKLLVSLANVLRSRHLNLQLSIQINMASFVRSMKCTYVLLRSGCGDLWMLEKAIVNWTPIPSMVVDNYE